MPKILFVALHRPDRSPSQRFRYEQYTEFLSANGWICDTSWVIPEKWDSAFYSPGKYLVKLQVLLYSFYRRWLDVFRANRYDVIFIQREAIMIGSTFFEKMFSRSKAKLVFDFDDAIWLPNVSKGNRLLSWMKSPEKTDKLLVMADVVFAGNKYLASYARKFNPEVRMVPTTVNTERHSKNGVADHHDNAVCIGWTGSETTLPHFESAVEALAIIRKKYEGKVTFKVIGSGRYHNEILDVRGIPWKPESEIEDLLTIDIGIMPLPDDDWSKGKCGLKGIQYMALEIPSVMSPVGMNSELIKDGENGFLAGNTGEWVEKLSLLIEDAALRKRIGKAARTTILERFSVDSQKMNYLIYLNELIQPR